MRNLGPVSLRQLAQIDVHTLDDLRALGAVEAWSRLRFFVDPKINVIMLYALEGALLDCDWRGLPPERKAQLKAVAASEKARA